MLAFVIPISIATVHGEWPIVLPDVKLKLRARLPGASVFDDAAFGLREARRAGVSASLLLPAALAGSWLVNSQVPSPVLQKWLAPALRAHWERLIGVLEAGGPPVAAVVDEALGAILAAGGSLGAVSKVLSLVCTAPVPLMPDAALSHVLRALPMPSEPDAQTASAKHFLPMLERMRESAERCKDALTALMVDVAPSLRPEDVLDRLLWFDSMGYRYFKNDLGGWYWARLSRTEVLEASDAEEAVVFVKGPPPTDHRAGACIEVPGEDEFSARAHEALTAALTS